MLRSSNRQTCMRWRPHEHLATTVSFISRGSGTGGGGATGSVSAPTLSKRQCARWGRCRKTSSGFSPARAASARLRRLVEVARARARQSRGVRCAGPPCPTQGPRCRKAGLRRHSSRAPSPRTPHQARVDGSKRTTPFTRARPMSARGRSAPSLPRNSVSTPASCNLDLSSALSSRKSMRKPRCELSGVYGVGPPVALCKSQSIS